MSDIKNKTGLYNSLNYIVLSKNELAQIHNFEQFKEIIELSFGDENIYQRYICIYNDSYSCSVIKSRKDIIDDVVSIECASKFVKEQTMWVSEIKE